MTYDQQLQLIRRTLEQVLPVDQPLILIDNEQLDIGSSLANRPRRWITEKDGQYDGNPSSTGEAISEIHHFAHTGATRLVFAFSDWWFQYYEGLQAALDRRYIKIIDEENLVIYNLQEKPASAERSTNSNTHKSSPRVAIFGYYGQYNFGDDLMAILFGKVVASHGATPVLYNLPRTVAELHGFETRPGVDELIEDCDLAIFGGGGLLCPRDESNRFSREIGLFLQACEDAKLPVAALSVGGDGIRIDDITPEPRRRIVEQARPLLIRNPQDFGVCQDAKIDALLCHDVVWATSLVLKRDSKGGQGGNTRIGINLYPNQALCQQLNTTTPYWFTQAPDVEFCFIDSHFRKPGDFRAYRPPVDGDNVILRSVSSVDEGIDAVLDLDLIISDRLHLGMTAMSYGVPALSFASRKKAQLAFKHVGFESMCWAPDSLAKLQDAFDPEFLDQAKARLNLLLDAGQREQANETFDILTNLIASVR